MPVRNADINYNTNLASEYLMMSLLCRAGKDAYLSLGNKKGVDIIVKTQNGAICIIEVKAVNKNNDWMIGNKGILPSLPNMFYALIGFEDKISDLIAPAKFYLIPSEKLNQSTEFKMSRNEKTIYLSHKYICTNYGAYLNTFDALNDYLTTH
jgi:hypothetical protein